MDFEINTTTVISSISIVLIILYFVEAFFCARQLRKNHVTDGSEIILQHSKTKRYLLAPNTANLYSHEGSSGGKQVGCSSKGYDIWILQLDDNNNNNNTNQGPGRLIKHGDIVNIIHKPTLETLKSHLFPSPLTNQREVTLTTHENDPNNKWQILIEGAETNGFTSSLFEGKKCRFYHVATRNYLHSHSGHSNPILTAGNQEVTCYGAENDENNDWLLYVALRAN
eukprot:TRINITY_DN233_c0_g1_i1.p1 TRINITY_DN233_c0_g1~~TRINITY_DN233_c0_g1_i1.p1  ORF type:complete len:225 (-),score=106.23 TRINITY_DN233_c0_g1_i1:202-876(-)